MKRNSVWIIALILIAPNSLAAKKKENFSNFYESEICLRDASFRDCFGHSMEQCLSLMPIALSECETKNPVFTNASKANADILRRDLSYIRQAAVGCTFETYAYMNWKDFKHTQHCVNVIQDQRMVFHDSVIRWTPFGKSRWKPFTVIDESNFKDQEAWDNLGITAVALVSALAGAILATVILRRNSNRKKSVSN